MVSASVTKLSRACLTSGVNGCDIFSTFVCSCKMGVPGKTEGTIFSPVPCEVILNGPERVGGERGGFVNQNELIVTHSGSPGKRNLISWHQIFLA